MVHNLILIVVGASLLLLNFNYDGRGAQKAPSLHFSPLNYQYIHFGYKSLLADSLWLRILPDIDTKIPIPANKEYSWQYEMIEAVTNLAPSFRAPHRNGAEVLSVILDDTKGATKIFEKGIVKFPNYWPLLYSAGYHYMEEEKNPARAAELLLRAHQNGGPEWLVSLAGKLYSESGQKELAIRSLLDFLKRSKEGEGRERVIARLKELGVDPSSYSQ